MRKIKMQKNRLSISLHKTVLPLLFIICLCSAQIAKSQAIDLLLKGGQVIDPKNKINSQMDVAITAGKISKVAANIPANTAKRVIDVTGKYVTPGFIDIHTHVFVGSKSGFADGFSSLSPDDITLKAGITTVVDAGTSGCRNFPVFKQQVIDRSQTRVLAFLNIVGTGISGRPTEEDINDMDAHMTSIVVQQYKDIIVGISVGHYTGSDYTPVDRAIEAGQITKLPLLLECDMPKLSLEEMLKRMRPGDIYTHSFWSGNDRNILDEQGNIRPYVLEAKKKGVLFDVGHGGGMFHFAVALPAFKLGFLPDSFGSDLHRNSMNGAMKDMLTTMSKYLNMGMALDDVIYRATWSAANSIHRNDLGNLSEGTEADIAVISIRKGSFGFFDTRGMKITGDRKLEAEMTLRAGRIVWDLNGLAATSLKNEN